MGGGNGESKEEGVKVTLSGQAESISFAGVQPQHQGPSLHLEHWEKQEPRELNSFRKGNTCQIIAPQGGDAPGWGQSAQDGACLG